MSFGIRPLKNKIRNYAWGSHDALAKLLGHRAPSPKPEAELWLGAHPGAPSKVLVDGTWRPLPDVIRDDPRTILGTGDELPFLFKILAVAEPLSIQAHPDRRQAEEGFRREDELGIPRDAPERNYRDPRPKPELIYALTPFELLRGFRRPDEIAPWLERLGAGALLPRTELSHDDALERFFQRLMELPEERLEKLLADVLDAGPAAKTADDPRLRHAASWMLRLAEVHPGDRGILAPLFLELRRLEPGEALFTGPGVLHAYLEGVGVELMTSSDNVLRGGLTVKHRDVPELLRVLRFVAEAPELLAPAEPTAGERRYRAPAGGFELSVFELVPGRTHHGGGGGVEILLATEGQGTVAEPGEAPLTFHRGEAFLVSAAVSRYELRGEGRVFRASFPGE